ncbi:MAG: ferredoxin-NADP reductase [Desulfurococcales archaeon ex4484_204]|nr:MAG: ferredoxin-NADP reductase [Desulfurococcales archaeon ex4484_204]
MYEVLRKKILAPRIKEMDVYVPQIAKSAKPGQFVIVIPDEKGERTPLTLVDWNRDEGWVRLVFLEVGVSTMKLGMKEPGSTLYYVAGPLGNPTHVEKFGTVVVIGGGVAIAAAYPIARAFKEVSNHVISVIGARSANLLIYEELMRSVSDELHITTDDGSKGMKGFTSDALVALLNKGLKPNLVWMVGPAPMMKACSEVTKKYRIKAIASLNPIMVCGMGMCGACRVKVGGKIRFTCYEGPEFDANEVDWDELIFRLKMYQKEELEALKLFLSKYGLGGDTHA